jgi:hypothetical protein
MFFILFNVPVLVFLLQDIEHGVDYRIFFYFCALSFNFFQVYKYYVWEKIDSKKLTCWIDKSHLLQIDYSWVSTLQSFYLCFKIWRQPLFDKYVLWFARILFDQFCNSILNLYDLIKYYFFHWNFSASK